MGSDVIPEDDDERGELYDDVDHPLPTSSPPASSQPTDDEIYEELPGIYHLVIHLRILEFFLPPNVIYHQVDNLSGNGELLKTRTKKILKTLCYKKGFCLRYFQ